MIDNIVICLDLGQYKTEYQEEVPFMAHVEDTYEHECIIKSLNTGKEYEVYYSQLMEGQDKEDIKKLINLDNYGR